MKEIPRTKKLEVAQYYILGYTYSDIENRVGVSHGSVVNIVKELEDGKLTIPGTSFDQVNDLRQLSFDLKKKGLEPSQALLGLQLFNRLRLLEITPELVGKWSELAKKLLPVDFPAKDSSYGGALGILSSVMDIGHSTGPMAGGLLIAAYNYKTTFGIIGGVLAFTSLAFGLIMRRIPKSKSSPY